MRRLAYGGLDKEDMQGEEKGSLIGLRGSVNISSEGLKQVYYIRERKCSQQGASKRTRKT